MFLAVIDNTSCNISIFKHMTVRCFMQCVDLNDKAFL